MKKAKSDFDRTKKTKKKRKGKCGWDVDWYASSSKTLFKFFLKNSNKHRKGRSRNFISSLTTWVVPTFPPSLYQSWERGFPLTFFFLSFYHRLLLILIFCPSVGWGT